MSFNHWRHWPSKAAAPKPLGKQTKAELIATAEDIGIDDLRGDETKAELQGRILDHNE